MRTTVLEFSLRTDRNWRKNPIDPYKNFSELARHHRHGVDFQISVRHLAECDTAVIAPHGGSIERRTSAIARAIAANDFSLYLFEGLDENGSYETLHITSHRFDEPRCVALVEQKMNVITVHGCGGDKPKVLLGGLNAVMKEAVYEALLSAGIECAISGHRYQGTHPRNICNRGLTNAGVQLEFTDAIRGAAEEIVAVETIRACLLNEFADV